MLGELVTFFKFYYFTMTCLTLTSVLGIEITTGDSKQQGSLGLEMVILLT